MISSGWDGIKMEQTAENEALIARKRRDEDMITIERG